MTLWDNPVLFLAALIALAVTLWLVAELVYRVWRAFRIWRAHRELIRFMRENYGQAWLEVRDTLQDRLFSGLDPEVARLTLDKITHDMEKGAKK